MIEGKTREISRLLQIWDLVLILLCFLIAIWSYTVFNPEEVIDFFSHLAFFPFILALILLLLPYFDAYRSPRSASVFFYSFSIIKVLTISVGILLMVLFFLNIQYVNRWIILIFSVFSIVSLISVRLILLNFFRRAVQSGSHRLRVLIIGSGQRASFLTKALKQKTEWGIDIVGYLDVDPDIVGNVVLESKIIGTVADIGHILKTSVIDEVMVAIPRTLLTDVDSIAHACEEEGVKFRFMADIFDLSAARISLATIVGVPLLTLEPVAQDESQLFVKRLIDLSLTVMTLPLALPLFGLIALAIKLDDGGPVFFVQERVGLKKRLFPMLKFRTMVVNAEEILKDIEHLNEADGPNFKIADDPRITRTGRFLRSTSLDELPQLINVLRGEMSLVGPRPMSIRDVDLFTKGIQRKRFSVKPGITCIWQISGRSNLPFNKWLELDLEYIDTWSLSLDLMILLKTIPVVLLRKGAM